ncbi:MAG: PhoX family protein [Bacillota bacterium]
MKKFIAPVVSLALLFPTMTNVFADSDEQITIETVEFIGMDAPQTLQEKNEIMYSKASAKVTYSNGSKKDFPLSYETLFRPGDVINGKTSGVTMDVNGNIITKPDGTPYTSTGPDANSLMKVPGLPEDTYYLVSHYESMPKTDTGGTLPNSMSLSTVKQDKQTGKLTVTDIKPIDFSDVHGLMKPCAGSLSPWNTHLGSEEADVDARAHEADPTKSSVTAFSKSFYNDSNAIGYPYYYGHIPEVAVKADGSTSVVKHYSMGRMSFEHVKVLPDHRTVLYGVDTNPGGLFMYVADNEGDLSAGTLYAAKWNQTSSENGGSANLKWISLGHATDKEIEQYADTLKFSDIFDATNDAAIGQAQGYTRVKTSANGKKDEWLKVKPGMEKAAAFLETHRYAAYAGATVEFNKMEGVGYNEKDNKGYLAISYLENTMLENPSDPTDHIHLPQISAGGVYKLAFSEYQKSSNGKMINSEYVPTTMSGLVMGEDLTTADVDGNTANVDKIANPDNVVYSEKMRTLFVAEDSKMHKNNYAWAYNIDTMKISRLVSVPGGGEATGLQVVDDLDGFSYLTVSAQNPGYVGYLAGLPSMMQQSDGNDDDEGEDD